VLLHRAGKVLGDFVECLFPANYLECRSTLTFGATPT
jgi:hypothetical protein